MTRLSPRLSLFLLFTAAVIAGTPRHARAAGMLPGEMVPAEAAGTAVGSIDVPNKIVPAETREIIAFSLDARGYTVKENTEQRLIGYLNIHGHEATFTFLLKGNRIDVYCEGYAVNKKGERKKPESPDGWIKNIKSDITRRLAAKAASK